MFHLNRSIFHTIMLFIYLKVEEEKMKLKNNYLKEHVLFNGIDKPTDNRLLNGMFLKEIEDDKCVPDNIFYNCYFFSNLFFIINRI